MPILCTAASMAALSGADTILRWCTTQPPAGRRQRDKDLSVTKEGQQEIVFQRGKVAAGVYMYSLILDGSRTAMKKMVPQKLIQPKFCLAAAWSPGCCFKKSISRFRMILSTQVPWKPESPKNLNTSVSFLTKIRSWEMHYCHLIRNLHQKIYSESKLLQIRSLL